MTTDATPVVLSLSHARAARAGDTVALRLSITTREPNVQVGSLDVTVPFERARLLPLSAEGARALVVAQVHEDSLRVSAIAAEGMPDGALATVRVVVHDPSALAGLTPLIRSIGSTRFEDLRVRSSARHGVRVDAP
ncbi:MAG: hypothetical protein MUE41_15820 [Gemmatimonadaceae bacterium]|nr:hypothetical protein [Gemmatimonadaceae bacterium]